jgi:hypothetical protein
MEHVFMGIIVLVLALTLICGAIVTCPLLKYVGIIKSARYSFAIMCIALGGYLASVSKLFFEDRLPRVNYSPELYTVRIIALVAALWFVANVAACSYRISNREGRRSFFVREDYPRKRKW